MKTRFLFIILISLCSCTLYTDRKNVSNSIPGEWELKLINNIDTLDVNAKFIYKKIDKDNFIQNFEFRDNNNNLISKGNYGFIGMGGSSFLMLYDSISNLNFGGEMTDFIYRNEKHIEKRPIKYIEFIDTVKTTNTVIKIQMMNN
jgi:hypothetical protein